jgi:hypothetical protein
VWLDPGVQLKDFGAITLTPSTVMLRPGGFVVTVTTARGGTLADPGTLVSYANYPSTEYLALEAFDFYTLNLYLHGREQFRKYIDFIPDPVVFERRGGNRASSDHKQEGPRKRRHRQSR